MKKVTGTLILLLLIVNLFACVPEKQTGEYGVPLDFMDKNWFFYDEVRAEHLCLTLGSDGGFAYHCQCGEPVGDSDLYDKYEYDSETGIIRLSNGYDNTIDEIKVLGYNEYHLMLEIDDEIKDFGLLELDTTANFYSFEGESYLSGYESRCTVVDIRDGKIVYGPVNYDPEGLYENGPFEEYELAENLAIFDMYIQRFNSIQDDQEYEEFYDVIFTEIGPEEIHYILDSGAGAAFLWFDDELKVEKIVFYGENSVTADYVSVTILPEETEKKIPEEYEAFHVNEDGSVIYLMTREQYSQY